MTRAPPRILATGIVTLPLSGFAQIEHDVSVSTITSGGLIATVGVSTFLLILIRIFALLSSSTPV